MNTQKSGLDAFKQLDYTADLIQNFQNSAMAVDFYAKKALDGENAIRVLGVQVEQLKAHVRRLENFQKLCLEHVNRKPATPASMMCRVGNCKVCPK